MNRLIFKLSYIFMVLFIIPVMIGCKSNIPSLSKEERQVKFNKAIEDGRYTFSAQSAIPMSYKSMNLSYGYYLKVSKDTIQAYLPYYGKSHSAPMDPMNIGIKFTSTNFQYEKEALKDSWNIKIKILDNNEKSQLYLNISQSGYANLQTRETNRESISFRGTIEIE